MRLCNGPDKRLLITLSLALVLGLGQASTAQAIVNIEGLRHSNQQQGLSGSMSLSFSGASGNTDKTSATASARLHWQHSQSTTLFISRYSYGESNQTLNTNKAFAHLRHIKQISKRRAIEGFVQLERNEFTRLSLRQLAGSGLRLTLHDQGDSKTDLGLGVFHSSETLDEQVGLSDSGTETLWRGNFYIVIKYDLNKQVSFKSTSYYQPTLGNSHDYRLLEQATLKIGLNDHLAIKLSLDISHDSLPPQSIDSTDISYRSGIEYQF